MVLKIINSYHISLKGSNKKKTLKILLAAKQEIIYKKSSYNIRVNRYELNGYLC